MAVGDGDVGRLLRPSKKLEPNLLPELAQTARQKLVECARDDGSKAKRP
jgi:hypothetical protein